MKLEELVAGHRFRGGFILKSRERGQYLICTIDSFLKLSCKAIREAKYLLTSINPGVCPAPAVREQLTGACCLAPGSLRCGQKLLHLSFLLALFISETSGLGTARWWLLTSINKHMAPEEMRTNMDRHNLKS